ncbi:MAG: anti-sigma factor [Solirubrobacteraceae bacterium]
MTELDRLPPDQRAVLSLVLDRGKSYAEVAELLGIPENTVRDRAHTALDALADDAAAPSGSRTGSGRSPRQGAEGGLSERPGTTGAPAASRFTAAGAGSGPARAGTGASNTPPPPPREPRSQQASAGSRRAGALLLGAIVVVIVVVVVIVSSGGGKCSTPTNTATGTTTTTTGTGSSSTSTTSATKPKLDSTIRLTSPEPSTNAAGVAYVLSDGSRRAFYVSAQGLPPSSGFFYAVWLYNSPSNAEPLGRASSVSSNGRMQGGNPLPSNAGDYAKFIITRETSSHPSQSGPTVLSGAFTLH